MQFQLDSYSQNVQGGDQILTVFQTSSAGYLDYTIVACPGFYSDLPCTSHVYCFSWRLLQDELTTGTPCSMERCTCYSHWKMDIVYWARNWHKGIFTLNTKAVRVRWSCHTSIISLATFDEEQISWDPGMVLTYCYFRIRLLYILEVQETLNWIYSNQRAKHWQRKKDSRKDQS